MTASQTVDTTVQLPAKHGVSPGGLRPVTIRQLLDATRQHSEAPFQIGDIEAHRISLMAHLVSVSTSKSSTTYELEDGTSLGRISARRWSSDADFDELPDDYSRLYVHIVGHLDRKVQLGDRNWVIIEQIYAVTDIPNRLFFHILEAAFVTLSLERGPPPITAVASHVETHNVTSPVPTPVRRDAPISRRTTGSSSQPQPAVSAHVQNSDPPAVSSSARQPTPRNPVRQEISATPIRQPAPNPTRPAMSPSPSPPPSSPSPGPSSPPPTRTSPPPQRASKTTVKRRQPGIKRDPYRDLTVLQRAILLQLMNALPSERGTNVSTIAIAVSHHDVTSNQIGAALDELVDLGHIESTIDDSHYAVKTSHYPRSI